ncbi:kinase-like protein, partial [Pholiota conissans]
MPVPVLLHFVIQSQITSLEPLKQHKSNRIQARESRPKASIISPILTDKVVISIYSHFSVTFHWIKGELIGRGSHGRVYLGFNATNGEIIAVKQVEVPTTADDRRKAALKDFVQRLREERKTLRDLYHPNIVQYLGYEENPETVNIFLEYVSGGTINGCLLEHGPFKEDVTKSFTTQILKGLSYLHSKDIIHRDLKSDNILIDPDGICKISDFGISKKLEKPRTHTFQGTYNWMAPEIFSDDIKQVGYDEKVDIWSVGCIVLEMWTGNKPWNDEHVLKIMNMLAKKRSPPIPTGLNLTILANEFKKECFQVDPAQRPPASLLVTHPYLTLPIGWTYPGM